MLDLLSSNQVSNGIKWMDDIQSFYRERSAIEKEYASKLVTLSSKYFEKKAKLSASLSVGDNPQVTPGSLENASLVAWNEVLTQTEQIGKERQRLAGEFGLQLADQIHGVELRYEDIRKRYSSYQDKLLEERDSNYSELKKAKAAYDSACQSMENQRLKASKSFDKSKDKANKKMVDKEESMNEAKNVYLIKINIANRIKDKYYHDDVPELLDGMQQVNESRVAVLNAFNTMATNLEKSCIKRCSDSLDKITGVVDQNKPTLDSAMFVKHNLSAWSEPKDFYYEPSPIWHDDEAMIVNDNALRFLKRRLVDCQKRLEDQTRVSEQKLEQYKAIIEQEKQASPLKSQQYVLLLGKHLSALSALTSSETLRVAYEVETETIDMATTGKDLSSLPAEVIKKKRGLFGLHRTRDDKTTADGSSDGGQLTRSGTTASTRNGSSAPGASFLSSLMGRHRHNPSSATNNNTPRAKALYAYTAVGDDELTVTAGSEMVVLEPDDGSGWTKVQIGDRSGLVPSSYIETIESMSKTISGESAATSSSGGKRKGPAVAPKRGAKKVSYMIVLYDYDATSPDELTIRAGDKILVVTEDSGDGWTEGELNGMSGVFPTAYAKVA